MLCRGSSDKGLQKNATVVYTCVHAQVTLWAESNVGMRLHCARFSATVRTRRNLHLVVPEAYEVLVCIESNTTRPSPIGDAFVMCCNGSGGGELCMACWGSSSGDPSLRLPLSQWLAWILSCSVLPRRQPPTVKSTSVILTCDVCSTRTR